MQVWIWIFRLLCAALALLAAITLYRALLHDRSRGRRRCPRCWYDLTGVQGLFCPECGRQSRSERSLLRTRRHYRRAALALLIAGASYASGLAPSAIRSGSWWSAVPTPVLVVVLQFYDDADDKVFQSMRSRLFGKSPALSTWERLLLARRCGKILLEPVTPTTPAPSRGPTVVIASTTRNPDSLAQTDATATDESSSPQAVQRTTVNSVTTVSGTPAFSLLFGSTLQSQALAILESLGPDAHAALPSLILCIDDPKSPHRYAAIHIVGRIGPKARSAVPALARQLTDASVIDSILDALLKLDTSAAAAAPQLRALLQTDTYVSTALGAVRVLRRVTPEPELIEFLRQILISDRPRSSLGAARGLELIGKPAAATIPDLARTARQRSGFMSLTAIQIIASFGPVSVPTLIEFVQTGDPDQQAAAAYWLGTLHQSAASAAPAAIAALSSPDPDARTQAANALGHIRAAAAEPELARLRDTDPVAHIRATAADAINRLKTP